MEIEIRLGIDICWVASIYGAGTLGVALVCTSHTMVGDGVVQSCWHTLALLNKSKQDTYMAFSRDNKHLLEGGGGT